MQIRPYQPGDEHAQAHIYNTAAGSLPAFKPATADEIARRYKAGENDAGSRFYAEVDGEVVAYAVSCPNGRISYPWCLPGAEAAREPLLDTVLREMGRRGLPEAWAAYRADWSPILEFLRSNRFEEKRQMINYLGELSGLPSCGELPDDRVIEPLARNEVAALVELAPSLFAGIEPRSLEAFFWDHPSYDFSESFFALRERRGGKVLAAGVLVISDQFADPTRIDAAMPCFRLGGAGDRARAAQARQWPVLLRVRRRRRSRVPPVRPRLAACTPGRFDPCGRSSSLRCDRPLRVLRSHLPSASAFPIYARNLSG